MCYRTCLRGRMGACESRRVHRHAPAKALSSKKAKTLQWQKRRSWSWKARVLSVVVLQRQAHQIKPCPLPSELLQKLGSDGLSEVLFHPRPGLECFCSFWICRSNSFSAVRPPFLPWSHCRALYACCRLRCLIQCVLDTALRPSSISVYNKCTISVLRRF